VELKGCFTQVLVTCILLQGRRAAPLLPPSSASGLFQPFVSDVDLPSKTLEIGMPTKEDAVCDTLWVVGCGAVCCCTGPAILLTIPNPARVACVSIASFLCPLAPLPLCPNSCHPRPPTGARSSAWPALLL